MFFAGMGRLRLPRHSTTPRPASVNPFDSVAPDLLPPRYFPVHRANFRQRRAPAVAAIPPPRSRPFRLAAQDLRRKFIAGIALGPRPASDLLSFRTRPSSPDPAP